MKLKIPNAVLILLLAGFFLSFTVDSAFAQKETCSSDYANAAMNSQNSGLVTAIMANITALLQSTGDKLYNHIIVHQYYTTALSACILLTVVIYGIMIVFDMENLRPGVIVLKLFKIGLVAWLASPSGWDVFSNTIAKFFFGTMLELVNLFLEGAAGIMAGNTSSPTSVSQMNTSALAEPLRVLGYPLATLFSAKYGITIIGLFFVGSYGIVMALLMIWGGFQLLLALFQALFVYVKCIVGLWFMFALAPIFFITFLFQRTSNVFTGWLNMVINFSLQPILLFAYLAFFIVIVVTSLNSLMTIEWCMRPLINSFIGIPLTIEVWRPAIVNGIPINYADDTWGLFGYKSATNLQFPLDMIDIMFFLLATYLCQQYGNFVPQLANQLSQGGLSVGTSAEEARQFFQTRGWTPEQIGAKAIGSAGSAVKGLFGS